jgi:hypothetical protein
MLHRQKYEDDDSWRKCQDESGIIEPLDGKASGGGIRIGEINLVSVMIMASSYVKLRATFLNCGEFSLHMRCARSSPTLMRKRILVQDLGTNLEQWNNLGLRDNPQPSAYTYS